MTNPNSFPQHLRDEGYHSRSNKHSNALAEAILQDLVRHCPKIREKGRRGTIVYDLNVTLRAGTADWNVDLVLGPPPLESLPPTKGVPISKQTPSTIEIAIEIKSVMTAHRKAVKNRKRDLEAHHEHVHNYNNNAIAGGVFVINASDSFQSPLLPEPTIHGSPARTVEHCVSELRSVSTRGGTKRYGLEAKCAIIVNMDNVNHSAAKYVSTPPAPPIGDQLHYDAFIRAICEHYTQRF
jgi:hypothetical protein